jgi:hypothetical protein
MRLRIIPLLVALLLTGLAGSAQASIMFSFGGQPIAGEASEEYPNLAPEGTAEFEVMGDMLTLTVTYTGVRDLETDTLVAPPSLNLALSGGVFDIDSIWTGSLDPVSVLVPAVVGNSEDLTMWLALAPNPLDFSGHTVFADDALGGTAYAVTAAGTVIGEEDLNTEIFDPTKTVSAFEPVPGGGDFLIVPELFDPTLGSFKKQGPQGQTTVVYKWTFDDEGGPALDESYFENFIPIFGTEGQPPLPEPTAGVLFPLGLLVVARSLRRR